MKTLSLLPALAFFFCSHAQTNHSYKVAASYRIQSPGGWDYLAVHEGKLYVSHGTQVNILDKATGDSIGVISNTQGVHGIAFNDALGQGYTSNGRSNNVTVFDLKTNATLAQIATGENPDAILYEPFTKMIITCNGKSKDLSMIDPVAQKTVATISVGGKPETAVSDGTGMLYVNIEDKSEIAAVNLATKTVVHHWPLNGAEGPTGLAYDNLTQRLFAGCEKQLAVVNATNGKVVAKLPIGDGCDGVAFDPKTSLIFTANGADGNMTVVKEENANKFLALGNYATKRGGRTIAMDAEDGTIFVPTADFEAAQKAGEWPKMVPGTFQILVIK